MRIYKTAQICANGHVITANISNQESMEKFCSNCGAETLTTCKSCNAPIRGYHYITGVIPSVNYHAPSYCYNCGKPYTWTQAKLDAAKELIKEMDELSPEEKEKFNSSLPDIIVDTPKTAVAVTRIRKYMNKISSTSKDGIKQLFFDITIEAAKRAIWPSS